MQVLGAGLHRTGTLSLKLALELLGFGPCYHMYSLMSSPQDLPLWRAAAAGTGIDWTQIFGSYGSAVDWPTCYFWPELAAFYGQAKIVLTVRDPLSWYESHSRLHRGILAMGRSSGSFADGETSLMADIMVNRTFNGRLFGRQRCMNIFQNHVDEVLSALPPSRVLIFDVKAGWDPLCEFLQVNRPDNPFPHANEADEVLHNMRKARIGSETAAGETCPDADRDQL